MNYFKLFVLIILPVLGKCFTLDNSGKYKLIVAIDENTAQNQISQYIQNIKEGVQALSEILYSSTNFKFSIQEVEIVVPSHWNVVYDGIATTQNYELSDIKISHLNNLPSVDNPNACREGSSIDLPYNFFNDPSDGLYGNIGEALLTLWVRWRFGAWEEHGFPGDTIFPYYWHAFNDKSDWEINACTNEPIKGDFKNIDDESNCSPSEGNVYPPSSSCRFFPDMENQTATSSLMSYHYLPTIDTFCNEETHNKKQPTPQNYFCRYKSIKEVIEASSDWNKTTEPNIPTPIDFKVLKTSSSPSLYILLDAGISQAPPAILNNISTYLKNFVGDSELERVVAAVGKYPPDNDGDLLKEIVPWTLFKDGYNQFSEAFDNTFGLRPGFRDFAGALKEAVRKVNERKSPKGGIVFIIKTGVETDIDALTPESDILIPLLVAKQKVFVIEIQGSEIQPGLLLENIANRSEGTHLALNSKTDLDIQLTVFMENLKIAIQSEIETTRNRTYALRGIVPHLAPIILKLNSKITNFEAFATSLKGSISSLKLIYISGGNGNVADAIFTEMKQWQSSSSLFAKVFYATLNSDAPATNSMIWDQFLFECEGESCDVIVTILIKTNIMDNIPTYITLSITTSAVVVDMALENAASDINAPFAIYARLKESGIPLTNTESFEVIAIITHQETSQFYELNLKDDGKAVPDISLNDGIFSGIFVPSLDGHYSILVTVKYQIPPNGTSPAPFDTFVKWHSQSSGKLFPIDQANIGCGSGHLGCWTKEPDLDFVLSDDLPNFIEFRNVDKYIPLAHRIMDFSVIPSSQKEITLEWSAPGVITSSGFVKVDSYEFKYSPDFEKLLSDFENCQDLFLPNEIPLPEEPGSLQSVSANFEEEADLYFAIRALTQLSGGNAPTPVTSVIAGASVRNMVVPTTTTTTTTIRPSTSSTTMLPTGDDITIETSTEDSTNTEAISTTPQRTSRPASTTPKPTTPLPTTTRLTNPPLTTSPEPPTKHWFQQKEGIITISVFGAGLILLIGFGMVIFRLKK